MGCWDIQVKQAAETTSAIVRYGTRTSSPSLPVKNSKACTSHTGDRTDMTTAPVPCSFTCTRLTSPYNLCELLQS